MCNRPSKQELQWELEVTSVNAEAINRKAVTESEDASLEGFTSGIESPGENDVMLGRGGESNKHIGNIKFRRFIEKYKTIYQSATRSEKAEIALEVVYTWREMDPPGRFLAKSSSKSGDRCLWHDVGDEQARKKASKSLGERKCYDSAPDQSASRESTRQKRFRDIDALDSEASKRTKPDCTSSANYVQNTTISCSHPWMPDDWSDSGSSGDHSVEGDEVCSDDISVTSQEPSFVPTEDCGLWQDLDGHAGLPAPGDSPVWVQHILRETHLPLFRAEELQSGILSLGARDALKAAMNSIPTAAELTIVDLFQ